MVRFRLAALICVGTLFGAAAVPKNVEAQANRSAAQASRPAAQANARASTGGGQCIASAAREMGECGNVPRTSVRPGGKAPTSRMHAAKRVQEEKKQGPTGPSIELDPATRRNRERIQARAWNLLQREVQVLNRLVRNTRTSDPRRPDIILRLAETYFEMQQAVSARAGALDEPIFQACQQQKNASRCRQLRSQQQQAQQQLGQYRQEAIRAYAMLVQDHPNYRRMDEVLFSLAFGLDEMRQFDRSRQVYHRLIKGFPQSRFIPHAYLSFAEFYFNEGDMRAANQFYGKVLEFPPARNPVYGYSLYKQAWANYNLEDFRTALQKFVEVIEFATSNPEARDAENLARQSRKELVLPYAMVGTPARALEFFQRYASNREQAMEMLEALGELYFDTGQWPNTIATYHKLMAENPRSDKVCYWQSKVTNAVISSRPKPEQVRELQRLVDLYEAYTGQGGHPAEDVTECKQSTAGVLVYLATAWHREAIGTEESPGTNDRSTMQNASQLYRMVVEKFPDMESMQFPDLDRRDWPTRYKVAYYYAELLWKMEDWGQCGPAFDRVVELNPQGEFTADAAYAAVLCYNNLYQQQYQSREREVRTAETPAARPGARGRRGRRGRAQPEETQQTAADEFAPREFTALEQGMLNAFQRYVCYVQDSTELPTVKYRRARIYYEANRFEEAAVLFKDIAWNHRDTDLAVYAANLYLDSLNVLGTKRTPARTECIMELRDAMDPLWGFYCATPEQKEAHSDLCGVVEQLRCDVVRKEAEAYEANDDFKRAASTYVRLFRRYSECGRLDEVLYNAAINFEAARLLGRAIQVRKVLIERFPESEWSKRAIFLVGANYHALAIYSQAATFYEEFARRFPGEDGSECTDEERSAGTCAIAHDALQSAVFFRLGLGEQDKAVEDARLFERNYRRKLPRDTSQVIFSLGTIYEQQENWNKVIDHYRDYLRQYRRTSLPQQIIKANVQLGLAFLKKNDKRQAEGFFRDAVRAWTGGAAEAIGRLEGADDTQKALYLYDAKEAASEALFQLAELKLDDFRRIRFPAYNGGRSLDRVNRWAQSEFSPWVEQKRNALRAAEAEYNKIAELEVPQWQIASAARIGEMYRSFVDEFRDAPIPTEIENDDELYGIYVDALDQQSEPLRRQAIEKFQFCMITATRVRWFNRWSEQCEQELNHLDPREYPLAAELRGSADYVHGTIARPSPVELGATSEEALEEEAAASGGDS